MATVHNIDGEAGAGLGAGQVARGTFGLRRPAVNITSIERFGRMAIGLFAIIAGALLLAGPGSALAAVLEVLLVLAGADLAVTGALGHCPLYSKVGHVPQSLRRTS